MHGSGVREAEGRQGPLGQRLGPGQQERPVPKRLMAQGMVPERLLGLPRRLETVPRWQGLHGQVPERLMAQGTVQERLLGLPRRSEPERQQEQRQGLPAETRVSSEQIRYADADSHSHGNPPHTGS